MRLFIVAVLAISLGGCKKPSETPSPMPTIDAGTKTAAVEKPACVPKVLVAIEGTPKIDGEIDEPVWHTTPATEPFIHEKQNRVVPHAEARAAYDKEALYLALYVGDADLTSSDQVAVAFDSGASIQVAPSGAMTCHFGAQADCAGVVAKVDRDGDVDADKEEDEEYIVELKLPWKLLGLSARPKKLGVNFSRIETVEGERMREVWSRGCGEISFAEAKSVIIDSPEQVQQHVGEVVTLHGVVENSKLATLLGVDVESTSPDLRGKDAWATGRIERYQQEDPMKDGIVRAGRGAGAYLRLVDPKTGQLARVRTSAEAP